MMDEDTPWFATSSENLLCKFYAWLCRGVGVVGLVVGDVDRAAAGNGLVIADDLCIQAEGIS